MKRLVLMHGAPGSGKSTFIRELGFEYLSISPDNLRLLFSELCAAERGISCRQLPSGRYAGDDCAASYAVAFRAA